MRERRRKAGQRARLVGRCHPDLVAMSDEVRSTGSRARTAKIATTVSGVAASAAAALGSTADAIGIAKARRGRVVTSYEPIRHAGRILSCVIGHGGIGGGIGRDQRVGLDDIGRDRSCVGR